MLERKCYHLEQKTYSPCSLKLKFMLEFVENMLYLAFPRSVGGNESVLWMWLDWGGFEVQKVQALHECLPLICLPLMWLPCSGEHSHPSTCSVASLVSKKYI